MNDLSDRDLCLQAARAIIRRDRNVPAGVTAEELADHLARNSVTLVRLYLEAVTEADDLRRSINEPRD